MDLQTRARAAAAIIDLATFGFNPGQRRGPDGRFIKMGGRGSAGPSRKAGERSSDRDAEVAPASRAKAPAAEAELDARPGALGPAAPAAAPRATPLETANRARHEQRHVELSGSTKPADNGAKVRALIGGDLDSAVLYRRVIAGPSGQRRDVGVGRVSYVNSDRGEFKIVNPDGGEVAGYATRTTRNGKPAYVVHEEGPNGEVRLRGWADTLSVAADVLVNGEQTAIGRHATQRVSPGSFEKPALKTDEQLDQEEAARNAEAAERRAARRAGRSPLIGGDAAPAAVVAAPAATPEIGPDGKYVKPVKQVATWRGQTATRTSRHPYNYASVVQHGDREPAIVSWHRTRAAAEKGVLTKDQRDSGSRVVGVAEVKPEQPGQNADISADAQRLDRLLKNAIEMYGSDESKWPARARADVARLRKKRATMSSDAEVFRFDPRQPRDGDGKWTDGGGVDVDSTHRDTVRRLRRIVEFDKEDGKDTTSSYTAEVARTLEEALDNNDQAEIDRWAKRASAIVETQERLRGLNEIDQGDGVVRGVTGFHALKRHQRGLIQGNLTREQIQDGLEQYLSNPTGYKAINEVARVMADTPLESMTRGQKERVRQLDRIVSVFDQDATTLQEDVEVWRGVRDPGAFLGDLQPGMEFVDSAPVSTSLDKKWASEFVTSFGGKKQRPEDNAIFKIRMKAGQKGLLANAITGEFDTKVGWEQERELLLPPGSRFRVLSRTEDTDAGGKKVPTYEVEVVDTPVQPPRAPAKRQVSKAAEPGRNLKKASDLPILDRGKALDIIRKIRDSTGMPTDAPEIQEQLVEAVKTGIDLNTRSAKLLLKDFNKYGGV